MKININTEGLEKIVSDFYKEDNDNNSKTNVSFKFEGYKNEKPKVKIVMEKSSNYNGININTEEVLSKSQLDKCIRYAFRTDYNISNIKFVTEYDSFNQDEYISGIQCEAKKKSLSD